MTNSHNVAFWWRHFWHFQSVYTCGAENHFDIFHQHKSWFKSITKYLFRSYYLAVNLSTFVDFPSNPLNVYHTLVVNRKKAFQNRDGFAIDRARWRELAWVIDIVDGCWMFKSFFNNGTIKIWSFEEFSFCLMFQLKASLSSCTFIF